MRHIHLFLAGFLVWSLVGQAWAQPAAAPQPNPLRDAAFNPAAPAPAARPPVDDAAVGETVGPPAGAASKAVPVVIAARVGDHANSTRFVVEVSDPIKFHIFTLSNPNRLVIDMPEVLWRLKAPPPPTAVGAVRSYRYGLFRPGNSRFVIDLNQPVRLAEPMVLPPEDGYGYRLVLDLYPTSQKSFNKTAGWPPDLRARERAAQEMASLPPSPPAVEPGKTPTPTPAPKPQSAQKIIVIDPGHGGIDSGTIGVTGMKEKNVVLSVGERLARDLRSRGYKVFMTRKTDVFIPLFDRDPFAHRHHADLFISLHANSNPHSRVHGLAVYTLSERGSDKEAAALARKENQSDIIAGVDLGAESKSVASILLDLQQRDTMNRSSRFAQAVLGSLRKVTDILSPDPHRSANFVVLRSPSIPAVLIELGFLSNPHDCHQMATWSWRDHVATAIANAVGRYFEPVVATAPDGRVE